MENLSPRTRLETDDSAEVDIIGSNGVMECRSIGKKRGLLFGKSVDIGMKVDAPSDIINLFKYSKTPVQHSMRNPIFCLSAARLKAEGRSSPAGSFRSGLLRRS